MSEASLRIRFTPVLHHSGTHAQKQSQSHFCIHAQLQQLVALDFACIPACVAGQACLHRLHRHLFAVTSAGCPCKCAAISDAGI